ncbi:MAG: prepilin peptidase [Candidatus Woesearchaeota archaeon]
MNPTDLLMIASAGTLVVSSYTDFKTREVPDWVSIGLIFTALGGRIIFSFYHGLNYFLEGMFGFAFFFAVAAFLFYTGQWGGGDAKLLMGLGAAFGLGFERGLLLLTAGIIFILLFGLNLTDMVRKEKKLQRMLNMVMTLLSLGFIGISFFIMPIPNKLIFFLINLLLFGGLYGLVWIIYMLLRNIREFRAGFSEQLNEKRVILRIVIIGCGLLLILGFFTNILFIATVVFGVLLVFFLWLAMKSVEDFAMVKQVNVNKLTEGDWIVRDVIIDGEYICGPADLGVRDEQIKTLKKLKSKGKIKKVVIKEGIPFVPSFLIAFVVTYLDLLFLI